MSGTACPRCGRDIGVDNINIREGVALCPSCGTLTRLGELAEDPALIGVAEGAPPRGCWIRDDGLESRVGASSRSVGGFLGALFFTLFWNGVVSIFVLVAIAGTWQHVIGPLPNWFPGPSPPCRTSGGGGWRPRRRSCSGPAGHEPGEVSRALSLSP